MSNSFETMEQSLDLSTYTKQYNKLEEIHGTESVVHWASCSMPVVSKRQKATRDESCN